MKDDFLDIQKCPKSDFQIIPSEASEFQRCKSDKYTSCVSKWLNKITPTPPPVKNSYLYTTLLDSGKINCLVGKIII